ncbi:MAG: ATP-binding protein [Microcoleus vaginatus WJT46-NPBG5]|jgi:hypothetical protein|nr:ATP-binding protein [Microcoleus vaginatus WJT46-NPBG5]
MANNQELLNSLYNAFNPFSPLEPGDPVYVDCEEVRGDGDIREDLGNRIRRSKWMTCQLYGGHRGTGKSTELLRLKQSLEENKIKVIYFTADEQDIDPEDAQYVDILLACTRHLLEDFREVNPSPLLNWLQSRWKELKDLALTEIKFEDLKVEAQIALFAKITANLRAVPDLRHKIREKVNPYTVTLIEALNQFINDAKKQLPAGYEQLVVIADNLDRIVPIFYENGRSNHEEIFLDRSEQLKALDCHLVYTVPISLIYSSRATDLREIYGNQQVLPMIMVQTPDGQIYDPGYLKVKEIIEKRVRQFAPTRSLETDIFDSPETLKALCLMSGGHVRNLLLLMQTAIGETEDLPISKKAVQRAITTTRITYGQAVKDDQWILLAEVAKSKRVRNDDKYRKLLFNRCILEYRYFDSEDELCCWYDVHPLIQGIKEFKDAYQQLQS